MNGFALLIRATAFEEMGQLDKAMELYHESALDEYERRERGDQPDDVHLGYL
jgi:GT2 family glycosyltransferase